MHWLLDWQTNFELEACSEYLLVDVGIVPMRVSRKFDSSNVIYCNEVY